MEGKYVTLVLQSATDHHYRRSARSLDDSRLANAMYVDEVSCRQKRSFQSVPKGSQEVDLLNRRGAP